MTETKSNKPKLLTLKQSAALIDGLTPYRVRQLCTEGKIKYHLFGKKVMISEKEILNHFGENA
ncbi:MAG: DNA-binding protein [Defluviitaleaceae bacterium]|nr:DNA-binding protein [Defluviitaleaceae bacterium]